MNGQNRYKNTTYVFYKKSTLNIKSHGLKVRGGERYAILSLIKGKLESLY